MKALYAFILVCLTAPAFAFDLNEQNAAVQFEYAAPIASYREIPSEDESFDPTVSWLRIGKEPSIAYHELDYEFDDQAKESKTVAVDPAEIWHEFDYDLKDGIKVAKLYPDEIWHEFDYALENGVKIAKALPPAISHQFEEVTASIPAKDTLLGDYYTEEAFVTGALPY